MINSLPITSVFAAAGATLQQAKTIEGFIEFKLSEYYPLLIFATIISGKRVGSPDAWPVAILPVRAPVMRVNITRHSSGSVSKDNRT